MLKTDSENKKQILEDIGYFFREEHNLDLGIIGREEIYDFFVEEIGKKIYNEALDDAKRFYDRQFENIESDYYALYKD